MLQSIKPHEINQGTVMYRSGTSSDIECNPLPK